MVELPYRLPMNISRILIALLVVSSLVYVARAQEDVSNATLVYVGTYTGEKTGSKGIYVFRLQTDHLEVSQNITLVPLGLAAETPNPSYLAVDLKRRLLFAVNEIDSFDGQRAGSVSSFSID